MRKGFIRQFLQNALALAVTILSGNWAIRYVYEIRGYAAAGGEYLFIPVVFLISYAGCNRLLDLLEEIRVRRYLERQPAQAEHDDKGVTGKC